MECTPSTPIFGSDSFPLYNLTNDIDDSFPATSIEANNKFKSEIYTLKSIWQVSKSSLEDNERNEREYKVGTCYTIYENNLAYNALTVPSAAGGLACTVSGLAVKSYPIFAGAWSFMPGLLYFSGFFTFLGCGVASIFPYRCGQEQKLAHFTRESLTSNNLQIRIKDCVNLLNKVADLYKVWQETKNSPSLVNMERLFLLFEQVQRNENGITTRSINKVEKLRLMDRLCESVNPNNIGDVKILAEWKVFINEPKIDVFSDYMQPIQFAAVKASTTTYTDFFRNRERFNECPIDSKITLLRAYINNELNTN